ncbi:MAG: hypothetical protein Q9178_007504 [Gyalolechia marmorata]
MDVKQESAEPVAVIGFSSTFPQDATSPEAFWQMLIEGRSAMTKVPQDRFNVDAFYDPDAQRLDTLNVYGGHFLKGDLAAFDAPFFSIPYTEALSLDPQQRGLMESTYKALENAGVPLQKSSGSKSGVFVGSFAMEYETLISRDPEFPSKYQASGTGSAMLANRLSWFYDFQGPSITLDTACSSSLNALHLACSSLRNRESTMAIVAGSNIMLNPDTLMMSLSNLNFLSPDSRCYSFDHRANGYARGEGFGVVVVKLLADALQDGDTIRAVIRATGSNQDGRTPGITQPSKDAQETLIRDTYLSAGLDLKTTRFFEAHGTGTAIGDPTEAAAISAVFKAERTPDDPLFIGAVKTNIGHLEGASGLAGLIKTIMVLESGVIPPNIWFERPHPSIHPEEWNIKFPVNVTAWPASGLRRASVNSFGYGGANAHVVLDDAFHYMRHHGISGKHSSVELPPTLQTLGPLGTSRLERETTELEPSTNGCLSRDGELTGSHPRLFLWTSSDEGGLGRWATVYKEYLTKLDAGERRKPDKFLNNLAYTLICKRSILPWKSYTVAESVQELISRLPEGLSRPCRSSGAGPTLGYVFTGQGAQWYAMGRELSLYPVYKRSMQYANDYLWTLQCPWSLIEELGIAKEISRINDPAISQPLCTACQLALVDLLASWGIHPSAVVGHSSGEIAAAYCAGGISFESAMKLAYYRGCLASRLANSQQQRRGSMMAVALSEKALLPYLNKVFETGEISIGCINSPTNITVTGTEQAITALKEVMDKNHIFARRLPVGVAYHSRQMEEVAAEYLTLIEDLCPSESLPLRDTLPSMYSSVTGRLISRDALCKGEYWVSNMCSRVLFADALSQMCAATPVERKSELANGLAQIDHIVEVGPHSALRRPIRETVGHIGYSATLKMDSSATETTLHLAGELCCLGYGVDLLAVNQIPLDADTQMLVHLPAYPFNHSQRYWHESRLSRNFRFRRFPPHQLLGTPSVDWNSLEPKWRNIIKVAENPWIKDHRFNGTELYPAAGIIVMVIEAARQLSVSTNNKEIRGYRLLDVAFLKAVRLSMSPEGVETQLHLRPRQLQGAASSERHEFRLYMISNNEWIENCRGTILTEYCEDDSEVDRGLEIRQAQQRHKETFARGVEHCNIQVDPKQLYNNLSACGIDFGPTFRVLENVSYSDTGEATATIKLHAWMNKVPAEASRIRQHLIHPTSLDGVLQLTVTAITKGGWQSIPTMVPSRLDNLWLSNALLTRPSLESIKAFSKSRLEGFREREFDIIALDPSTDEPLIVVDGYRATAVSSLDAHSSVQSDWRRLCYSIDWKPDLDLLNSDRLAAHCNTSVDIKQLYTREYIAEAELACLYFISEALNVTPEEKIHGLSPHLESYKEWMRYHCDGRDAQAILSGPQGQRFLSDPSYREALLSQLEKNGAEGEVYITIGRNLVRILRGEVDPLELLVQGQHLQKFYSSPAFTTNYQKISAFVDLSAHKNPNQFILEIGAGTGGATGPILNVLGPPDMADENGTPRYEQYTYTDISAGFFQDAKERFSRHLDRLIFRTLDIEKDPLQQGFEKAKYDIIIASCVLHATANVDTALSNVRKLLKPGGRLILLEPCNLDCSRLPFVFGLLPGWWLGTESHRRWGPLLSDHMWHEALLRTGFSGADVCLRDYAEESHMFSVMTSTAVVETSINAKPPRIFIIIASGSSMQYELGREIRDQLQCVLTTSHCEIVLVEEIPSRISPGAFCIFLPEVEAPFLSGIREADFISLQTILKASSEIVWVTCGGGQEAVAPEMGLAIGFGRCMCTENSSLDFISLSLEKEPTKAKMAEYIIKIVRSATSKPRDNRELEYLERNGTLCINRVVEDNRLNGHIFSVVVPQKPALKEFGGLPTRPLALTISSPGLLDTLHFADDPAEGALGLRHIEVKVKAVGVNFKNVMVALGQLPDKSLGQECAGVVTQIGTGVSAKEIRVGDRVCCVTDGAFKTYARSHISSVYRIPEDMNFTTAAALPVAFCTAYYSLHSLAKLKERESILIHAAAGGVGQAAIQLARLADADIYVTVGTDQKKRLLMDLYNIPEDRIFSSRTLSFAQGIKRLTNNCGVDIVLNSLAGQSLQESLKCVAPLGRFIEIGKRDMYLRESLSMSPFLSSITFASVDLGIIAAQAHTLMTELMASVMSLATGSIKPPQPLTVFGVSQLENAFRFLQSGKNAGKTVIEIREEDLVPIAPTNKPSWYFDEDATYVITGGLGGLGRCIARWMVSRRAKHLLLLSRSGPKHEAAINLLEELKHDGVQVQAPACDISKEGILASVLAEYANVLPPIKGCIQGSMVLKDALFENMTVADFEAALCPKVQGTWNLHAQLPKEMDFFILLSSAGAVWGSRGQSNYAAGNTYQDALARYRVSLGEKCVSLNVGLMLEAGFAAERQAITDSMRAAGYEGIRQAEFLAMLDYYCNPALPLLTPDASQVVTGVDTPASLRSRGLPELYWMSKPLFRGLRQMDRLKGNTADASKAAVNYQALVGSAETLAAAGGILTQALAKKLSLSLSMPEEDIETDKPIHAYGVDSLVAVEIRYWFLKEFKAEIAVFDILGSESIAALSVLAARRSDYVQVPLDEPK